MITSQKVCKMAGLLEGEGWFGVRRGGPAIKFCSTDYDVVAWVAAQFGNKVMGPYRSNVFPNAKPIYVANTSGDRAAGWMMTVYSEMGARRKTKIREVLRVWKAHPITPSYTRAIKERTA